jgi:hypothetical protein
MKENPLFLGRGRHIARRLLAAAVAALLLLTASWLSCSKQEGDDTGGEDLKARLDKMRSLPYTSVTDEKAPAGQSGVVLYDRDRAWPGYNLYFDRLQTRALLLDMEGRVVHQWSDVQMGERGWQHGILLENGDIMTFVQDMESVRINWNSVVLWKTMRPVHHEICRLPDGTFWLIGRMMETYRELLVMFPVMIRIDGEGREIERWSTYEHLDEIKKAFDTRSFIDTILDKLSAEGTEWAAAETLNARSLTQEEMDIEVYDYFHMNSISVVPDTPLARRDPRFAPGNLIICMRNVNQIAVLEKDTMRILWVWGEGELEWPHNPGMLEDGSILVFDNGVRRGYSRVVEVDPESGSIGWQYVADPPQSFYSETRGSAQRLPNGNTLICESDRGRVFEVTRNGDTVWEWYNPRLVEGQRVQVYRMLRYPPGMVEPLLGSPDGSQPGSP